MKCKNFLLITSYTMNGQETKTMEEQFLQAYDELADGIFRHCYFRIYDYERARELMQETFTRAWEYLAKGKKVQNLKAFIYKIATNIIIDETRKKKTVSLEEIIEQGTEIKIADHDKIIVKAEAARFIGLMKKMKEKERNLIVMRYINNMSPKEIAENLGKTENAVSVGLNRAIKKLKNICLKG